MATGASAYYGGMADSLSPSPAPAPTTDPTSVAAAIHGLAELGYSHTAFLCDPSSAGDADAVCDPFNVCFDFTQSTDGSAYTNVAISGIKAQLQVAYPEADLSDMGRVCLEYVDPEHYAIAIAREGAWTLGYYTTPGDASTLLPVVLGGSVEGGALVPSRSEGGCTQWTTVSGTPVCVSEETVGGGYAATVRPYEEVQIARTGALVDALSEHIASMRSSLLGDLAEMEGKLAAMEESAAKASFF